MYQKTAVQERPKITKTPSAENKKSFGGKTLPAIAPAQLAAEEELPAQGKFETAQLAAEEELPAQGKFKTTQLAAEEELPAQGKFKTTQLAAEEELPAQGKFKTTQLAAEEELPAQGKFETAQLAAEEELPAQGKFETAQLAAEEELPAQGKFETAQLAAEEELPAQGKFETAQLAAEEELPAQGKFETAQLAAEEELPAQGKFEIAQLAAEEELPAQGKFETTQLAAEEELPAQGKFEPIQKAGDDEDPMQLKESFPIQKKKSNTTPFQLKEAPGGAGGRTGLPGSLKAGIENLSGFNMDDVRVHYNSSKPKQLKAHAYAQGTDIHIGPGQEKHLAHEAWHVAQQKQGRVKPTVQMKGNGVPVNDDVGLETEADTMGAKAAEQGKAIQAKANSTAQLKFNTNLLSGRRIAQRQVVQKTPESEEKFQSDNVGILKMITSASSVLATIPWGTLAAGSDTVGTVASATGVVGSLTNLSGSATNYITGDGKPDIAKAAGDITGGIGSTIGALVKSVVAVKKIFSTAEGKESKLFGAGETAVAMMSALKAGCEAAVSIQKYLTGGLVPQSVISLIPGLGIAIAACDIIKNSYTAYNAYGAEAEMTVVSGAFRGDLEALLGGSPEEQCPGLFANEKRGKFGNRITYLRLKPGLLEVIDSLMDQSIPRSTKETMIRNFKSKNKIPQNVDIAALYSAIKFYELGSKMQEINQKRKVQGARNIFTSMLSLAGEIAKFFPADGGVTAGILLGASAAVGAAQSAGKFIQGVARNNGILGGDTNRSSSSKHKEYVNHTRSIYEFFSTVPQPTLEEHKPKVNRCEQLLRATGVTMASVYDTDYSNTGSVTKQVNLIVDAMKAGR
jgi:hypothetical protein